MYNSYQNQNQCPYGMDTYGNCLLGPGGTQQNGTQIQYPAANATAFDGCKIKSKQTTMMIPIHTTVHHNQPVQTNYTWLENKTDYVAQAITHNVEEENHTPKLNNVCLGTHKDKNHDGIPDDWQGKMHKSGGCTGGNDWDDYNGYGNGKHHGGPLGDDDHDGLPNVYDHYGGGSYKKWY